MRLRKATLAGVLAVCGVWAPAWHAAAHEGPPFPITEHAQAGAYELSVWADADVGDGALWVVVNPAAARGTTATTLSVTLTPQTPGAQPQIVAGRLEPVGGVVGDRFVVDAPFKHAGLWQVRMSLGGGQGAATYDFTLEVEPEGPQPGQIPFFLLPFAMLAILAAFALWRKRAKQT